jgi:hypothetical protein
MARLINTDIFSYNDETGLVGNTGQSAVLTYISDETGGGGSITPNVSIIGDTNYAEYVVRVSSNQSGANIFVNGVNTQKTTPENISVTKTQLVSGDVEITVSKEGFSTLEKYVLSLSVLDGSVVINNSRFDQPLGLSTADINIQYFIGNTEQTPSTLIKNGNFIFTDFTLSKTRILPTDSNLLLFNVFVAGVTNSVLVNKNGQVDLYPTLGSNNYGDIKGTLFSIKSSDARLYRITEIIVEGEGETVETLTANTDESLNINLTLNKSYSVKIQTEELRQSLPALDPKVSLLDSDTRTYNINSKVGVPLVIRKNSDVKAITVVVGETIFEFDTLDEGDIAGVTIPHSAFRGLGQYSVKIYPFSLKNYETQVRPTTPPFVVKQNVKNIKTPVVEVSEVVEIPLPKQFITPYELPTLGFIPTTPTISTTPQVRSNQPIVRGGGGIVALDRDFGSGFGVERVVDRTLLNNENIQ